MIHFREIWVALKRAVERVVVVGEKLNFYFPWAAFADDFLGRRTAWMLGKTPP